MVNLDSIPQSSYEVVAHWFTLVSDQRYIEDHVDLGLLHQDGNGITQSYRNVSSFKSAAEVSCMGVHLGYVV